MAPKMLKLTSNMKIFNNVLKIEGKIPENSKNDQIDIQHDNKKSLKYR